MTGKEPGHARRRRRRYDRTMREPLRARYYGNSDYFNFGYWTPETKTQAEASRRLLEELLEFIPEKNGTILDVACGLGASTRDLLNYYRPEDVTGINISLNQIEHARSKVPGVRFLKMDAVELEFDDESFDNIVCIEAIHHFSPRQRFLSEAYRVLKPGGRLVTSDVIGKRIPLKPAENRLSGPEELRGHYAQAGFTEIQLVDATQQTALAFIESLKRWPRQERQAGRLNRRQYAFCRLYASGTDFLLLRFLGGTHYLLTSARKPPAGATPEAGEE